MAERTYVVQKTQIGIETTPGTGVAASKRLLGTSIEFEPQVVVQDFTPLGSKYAAVVAEQKEWMQAAIKGYPAYGDMAYLLSSLMSAAVVTTAGSGKKYSFDSSVAGLDTPKTFTVEQGDTTRAQRSVGMIVKDLGLKFNRNSVDVSGAMIGKRLEDGITLTASPTSIPIDPMLATSFDVFIDPSDGTSTPPFGTTKLGRLFEGDWTLNNRFGPFWVVDTTATSYSGTVELMPAGEFKIIVEADAAGMGYLNTLRLGSTVMCRIRSLGPLMSDAITPQSFTIDQALKVNGIDKYSDQEGVYAIGFSFKLVEDAGWGKAIHAEVVCPLASL